MAVPLLRVNRSKFNDQVVVGFSRPLKLVGADGCQSRDHGRTARSFQLFLYSAPKIHPPQSHPPLSLGIGVLEYLLPRTEIKMRELPWGFLYERYFVTHLL